MTLEEKVYALLSADTGVSALVNSSRIKVPGDQQNVSTPYIVHQPISNKPEYMHEGRIPLTEWFYQVDCVADSYSQARAISSAVVAALSGQHAGVNFFWRDQTSVFEADIVKNRVVLHFQVFEAL